MFCLAYGRIYLKPMPITHNKILVPLLNLLSNYISAESGPAILL